MDVERTIGLFGAQREGDVGFIQLVLIDKIFGR